MSFGTSNHCCVEQFLNLKKTKNCILFLPLVFSPGWMVESAVPRLQWLLFICVVKGSCAELRWLLVLSEWRWGPSNRRKCLINAIYKSRQCCQVEVQKMSRGLYFFIEITIIKWPYLVLELAVLIYLLCLQNVMNLLWCSEKLSVIVRVVIEWLDVCWT